LQNNFRFRYINKMNIDTFIQYLILITLLISAIIALNQFRKDTRQKVIDNTFKYLQNFDGNQWISEKDKLNWNKIISYLQRVSCAELEFGDYIILQKEEYPEFFEWNPHLITTEVDYLTYENPVIPIEIADIFSEGVLMYEGKSIVNILNVLEIIAKETLKGNLDIHLINLSLSGFYSVAMTYIYHLDKALKELDPKSDEFFYIKKLNKKLFPLSIRTLRYTFEIDTNQQSLKKEIEVLNNKLELLNQKPITMEKTERNWLLNIIIRLVSNIVTR